MMVSGMTETAAQLLGIAPTTLAVLRGTARGHAYTRLDHTALHACSDLDAWRQGR